LRIIFSISNLLISAGDLKRASREGEQETDIPLLAEKVGRAFANHPYRNGRKLQVWFEPENSS
jgi:hypothetical protein